MPTISISSPALNFLLDNKDNHLQLNQLGDSYSSWLHPNTTSRLFTVFADNQRIDGTSLELKDMLITESALRVSHVVAQLQGSGLAVELHINVYEDSAIIEIWQSIRNAVHHPIDISRIDSCSMDIYTAAYDLLSYSSDWGQEFEPVFAPLAGDTTLESKYGRSSKGQHPWFALFNEEGHILSGSVAWSGNWIIRFERLFGGSYRLSGGLHDAGFHKTLAPGASMETPMVILTLGPDLNTVSQQYAHVGRRYWYPRNVLSASLPVEWNPWFGYEDRDINHATFRQNAVVAAELGVELCVLDAGWFGPSDAETRWFDYRGDWEYVNKERFPQDIRSLSDEVHRLGMKFGLWCEIEGLGPSAELAMRRPDFVARLNDESLGYVCFGNPQVQKWAYETLQRLITDYNCDWIKLDFNVDPGLGCNCTDHGHGIGDGLYEHYVGYYSVLDRLRRIFPEVVLENCSSGGLRIDLGIAKHTYLSFLSDPDWHVHNLQVFWGVTNMLAPDACLHWSFSYWINPDRPSYQTFNPHDSHLQPHQLDYFIRTAMLNGFGFSQRLPELPAWVIDQLRYNIRVYKDTVRHFVREATLYRLTEQPRRSGQGDRWSAYQYSLPDGSEHLLFVFRLPGAATKRAIFMQNLNTSRIYRIESVDGGILSSMSGHDLMENGVSIDHLPEESSMILKIF